MKVFQPKQLKRRNLHRYRTGHGFHSRSSLNFFQVSSFQLVRLKNLHCDDLHNSNYVRIKNLKCSDEYIAIELLLLIKVTSNLLVLVLCWSKFFCLLKLYVGLLHGHHGAHHDVLTNGAEELVFLFLNEFEIFRKLGVPDCCASGSEYNNFL